MLTRDLFALANLLVFIRRISVAIQRFTLIVVGDKYADNDPNLHPFFMVFRSRIQRTNATIMFAVCPSIRIRYFSSEIIQGN